MQKNKNTLLLIDIGTQLKVEVAGFEGRFKCNLVGLKPNKHIIIDAPPQNVSRQLQEGTNAIIRYLYFGNIFGFKSKTLKYLSAPYDLLFLTYPDKVESHNLRKNARIQCYIPATTYIQDVEVRGVIVDISVSGCQYVVNMSKFDLSDLVKINSTINLAYPFFGATGLLTVQATILHINCNEGNLFLGMKFEDLDPEIYQSLENYIEEVNEHSFSESGKINYPP